MRLAGELARARAARAATVRARRGNPRVPQALEQAEIEFPLMCGDSRPGWPATERAHRPAETGCPRSRGPANVHGCSVSVPGGAGIGTDVADPVAEPWALELSHEPRPAQCLGRGWAVRDRGGRRRGDGRTAVAGAGRLAAQRPFVVLRAQPAPAEHAREPGEMAASDGLSNATSALRLHVSTTTCRMRSRSVASIEVARLGLPVTACKLASENWGGQHRQKLPRDP